VLEPEGWARLPELDPESGGLAAQLFVLERLRDRLGGDTPILQTVFSPLAQAKNLAGEATLFEHLHRDPESVQAGLETIARTTVRFVEAASRRGIAGVFYAVQHASFHYFDSQSYARIAEAHDRRILEAAGGLRLNLLHLHGQALMFDLGGRLPAQVVNWHDRETGPSLAEGKARCGKAVCGGLQRQATLVLGTPEAVRAEARQALEAVGRRGVILGAGCVVPIVAPRANLMAARRAVDFA
jgi:uroporphyrinogen decarboxylase